MYNLFEFENVLGGIHNMINRLLEKSVELIPNENAMVFKSSMKLEYYLLESNSDDMDELSGKKVYGVEIIKKVDGMNDEMQVVKNLSCCINKTKAVINKLAKNSVTPVSLRFILDDMIGV